jgi:multiple antibiotic resistance protein
MNVLAVAGSALAALLPITNPVGALASFAGLTGGMAAQDIRRQAVRTALYVFAILAVFTILGSLVLEAFGITLGALQVAGGLVVAHSGFGMISAAPHLRRDERDHAETKDDVSFSPMALPLVAGPGAIGVVIALTARHPHWDDRAGIVGAVAVIAVLIGGLLRFGTPLVEKLGPTGIGALTRIIGFLILAIGVELVAHGLQAIGHL